jgi:hypothetical protein
VEGLVDKFYEFGQLFWKIKGEDNKSSYDKKYKAVNSTFSFLLVYMLNAPYHLKIARGKYHTL